MAITKYARTVHTCFTQQGLLLDSSAYTCLSLSSTMSARLAQHIRPPAPQYSIWAIDYETSYDEVEGLWGTISEADLLPFTLGQPTCRARGTPSNWLNKDGGALFVRSRGTAQMFFVHPCLLVPLVRSDDVHGLAP